MAWRVQEVQKTGAIPDKFGNRAILLFYTRHVKLPERYFGDLRGAPRRVRKLNE